jgi:hypothetical protein
MASTFTLQIPESNWKPMEEAVKDGRLIWIRDDKGDVDLAQWDHGEWNAELGSVDEPVQFADVSIVGYPDRNGSCGRCGRYRGGP